MACRTINKNPAKRESKARCSMAELLCQILFGFWSLTFWRRRKRGKKGKDKRAIGNFPPPSSFFSFLLLLDSLSLFWSSVKWNIYTQEGGKFFILYFFARGKFWKYLLLPKWSAESCLVTHGGAKKRKRESIGRINFGLLATTKFFCLFQKKVTPGWCVHA